MDKIKIINETLPKRCDICHQADCFDQVSGTCKRCKVVDEFIVSKSAVGYKEETLIQSKLDKSENLLWVGKPQLNRVRKKLQPKIIGLITAYCFVIILFGHIHFTLKYQPIYGFLLAFGVALFFIVMFSVDLFNCGRKLTYAISDKRILIMDLSTTTYSYLDTEINNVKITELTDNCIDIEFDIKSDAIIKTYNAYYRVDIIKYWYGINDGKALKNILSQRFPKMTGRNQNGTI